MEDKLFTHVATPSAFKLVKTQGGKGMIRKTVLLITSLLSLGMLTACGEKKTVTCYMEAPVAESNNETISWNTVDNANHYELYDARNDTYLLKTEETEYVFDNFINDFPVYVIACWDNQDEHHINSLHSNHVEVSHPFLEAPKVKAIGNKVIWDKVTSAKTYQIYNSDTNELLENTGECFFEIEDAKEDIDVYVIASYNKAELKVKDSGKSNIVTLKKVYMDSVNEESQNIVTVDSYIRNLTVSGQQAPSTYSLANRDNGIDLYLNNVSLTSSDGLPCIRAFDSNNPYTLRIHVTGDNYLTGADSSYGNAPGYGIYAPNLELLGDGNLTIKCGSYRNTNESSIVNPEGKNAIVANAVTIDGPQITVYGGEGKAFETINSKDGGQGGSGIKADQLILKNGSLIAYGGNGGNGSIGLTGKDGRNGASGNTGEDGTNGKNGEKGGNGGHGGTALNIKTSIEVNNGFILNAYGGKGGNAGQGGNGGNGGKGGISGYLRADTGGNGGKGGNGGNGGNGGQGGYAVNAQELNFADTDASPTFMSGVSGLAGDAGHGGKGGDGGNGGNKYLVGLPCGGNGGNGGDGGNGGYTLPSKVLPEGLGYPHQATIREDQAYYLGEAGLAGQGGSMGLRGQNFWGTIGHDGIDGTNGINGRRGQLPTA